MSIYVNRDTRVLVQGITGSAGSFHTEQMLDYGTRVVAGVTPNRGGTKFQGTVPIFHTVAAAVKETGAAGMKDMGKVIGVLRGKYAGQMDMAKASGMVKARLS